MQYKNNYYVNWVILLCKFCHTERKIIQNTAVFTFNMSKALIADMSYCVKINVLIEMSETSLWLLEKVAKLYSEGYDQLHYHITLSDYYDKTTSSGH